MKSLIITFLLFITASLCVVAQDVQTGPQPLFPSEMPSEYLRGIRADSGAVPASFRILGARRSAAGITVDAILLDALGNFLAPSGVGGVWEASYGCRGEPIAAKASPLVDELTWTANSPANAVQVFIDHSLTSGNLAVEALRGLKAVLPGIAGTDSIGIAVFDHEMLELSAIDAPYVAAQSIAIDSLGPAAGLPAVHTAMMSGLHVLEGRGEESKALIMVTASNDMTTLSYSSADIVKKARAANIQVHVIKVGTMAHGYVYRYITAATGGRLYQLGKDQASDVAPIVREILYGMNQHLELFIPMKTAGTPCDDILLRVGLASDTDSLFADTIMIPFKERAFRTTRAVVAAFADTNEAGLQDYYPILAVLAEDLLADSAKTLQLVGHVSNDVKGDAIARGLERVNYVSDFLQAYGVPASQLRVRSEGSRHPLFYLQLDGTQRLLNNRVEAYFLIASDLPYTIAVSQFETEEQAGTDVAVWMDRGYKAYFEPIVVKRSPAYQVRLWGYATEKQANDDLLVVKNTFGVKGAVVE